jgi:hypothetical protein
MVAQGCAISRTRGAQLCMHTWFGGGGWCGAEADCVLKFNLVSHHSFGLRHNAATRSNCYAGLENYERKRDLAYDSKQAVTTQPLSYQDRIFILCRRWCALAPNVNIMVWDPHFRAEPSQSHKKKAPGSQVSAPLIGYGWWYQFPLRIPNTWTLLASARGGTISRRKYPAERNVTLP